MARAPPGLTVSDPEGKVAALALCLKEFFQRSEGSGRTDTTEEATFCQKLKSRIKERSVPRIDELLVTSNKGDGYRMKGNWEHPQVIDLGFFCVCRSSEVS